MTRKMYLGIGAIGVAVVAAAIPLLAQQPYPTVPSGKTTVKDLVVPSGIYQTFVLACSGNADSTARVVLKTPSGELTVIVRGGDTSVVPLGSWTLAQQATMKVTEGPGATLYVSAMTVGGPVNFDQAKK
ncbi:MAG: hypothetical protein AB7G11_09800 [Phycisphaerales bacterium]